jgi:hypothetical protein
MVDAVKRNLRLMLHAQLHWLNRLGAEAPDERTGP